MQACRAGASNVQTGKEAGQNATSYCWQSACPCCARSGSGIHASSSSCRSNMGWPCQGRQTTCAGLGSSGVMRSAATSCRRTCTTGRAAEPCLAATAPLTTTALGHASPGSRIQLVKQAEQDAARPRISICSINDRAGNTARLYRWPWSAATAMLVHTSAVKEAAKVPRSCRRYRSRTATSSSGANPSWTQRTVMLAACRWDRMEWRLCSTTARPPPASGAA